MTDQADRILQLHGVIDAQIADLNRYRGALRAILAIGGRKYDPTFERYAEARDIAHSALADLS